MFGEIHEDHADTIRVGISVSSGVVVSTAGDSFFATFREPLDGVRPTAIATQLRRENTKTE